MRPQPGPHDSHWGNSVACASSPSVAPSLTQTLWGISHPSVSHRQPSAPGSAPGLLLRAHSAPSVAWREERGRAHRPWDRTGATPTAQESAAVLGVCCSSPHWTGPFLPLRLLRLRLSLPVCRGGPGTRTELLGGIQARLLVLFQL